MLLVLILSLITVLVAESSTLIGRDTVFSLVETYYAGAKIYAIRCVVMA